MIKMTTAIASSTISFRKGDETDYFSEAEEARLIASGAAEPVKAPAPKRKARKAKTETASAPTSEVETAIEA